MDANPPDVPGRTQPGVRPGTPGISRFVDAVAIGDVEADRGLAGTSVDHIMIGAGHGDRADGGATEEAIGNAAPIEAAIGGLPDAASARAEVEHHGVFRITRDGDDAT